VGIPLELLKLTESRAWAGLTYGKPGLKKTNAAYTLPEPILFLDFEGGTNSITPWIRRRRRWNESNWTVYSQSDRESIIPLLTPEVQKSIIRRPAPLIDLIWFDVLEAGSYEFFVQVLGNLDNSPYNSLVLDSLQEFSIDTQTFAKRLGGVHALDPMELKLWGGAQERAAIALRRMRNLRDRGIFIYLIGSENIDKDYVTDPRSLPRGASPEQPFSVSATVNLPGKLVGTVEHVVDAIFRARALNGDPVWVTFPEPLPGGSVSWAAKDRFGRLDRFIPPNFHKIFAKVYGEAGRDAIYASASERNKAILESAEGAGV
jgi:hypothetical protein